MMSSDTSIPTLSHALTGAFRRLAQVAHVSNWDQWATLRLSPSQRRILEILIRDPERRSLSALARELGVTAATTCDSVAALEKKGLVRKDRSVTDGRALALVLTEQGQLWATRLASLPDPLLEGFGALENTEQAALYRLSLIMIHALEEAGTLTRSRTCVRCKFFDPFCYPESATPHHCNRIEKAFDGGQVRIDCPMFEAERADGQPALWQQFVRQSATPGIECGDDSDEQATDGSNLNRGGRELESVAIAAAAP